MCLIVSQFTHKRKFCHHLLTYMSLPHIFVVWWNSCFGINEIAKNNGWGFRECLWKYLLFFTIYPSMPVGLGKIQKTWRSGSLCVNFNSISTTHMKHNEWEFELEWKEEDIYRTIIQRNSTQVMPSGKCSVLQSWSAKTNRLIYLPFSLSTRAIHIQTSRLFKVDLKMNLIYFLNGWHRSYCERLIHVCLKKMIPWNF